MASTESITLCCVDTVCHALSAVALRRSSEANAFAKTIFLTDRPEYVDKDWECHRIKTFSGYQDFNRFLFKNIYYHIETEFVLTVQFDGFVLDGSLWSDEFLEYDYIGAPWPCDRKEYAVGTGGFSLRSQRLLQALQDDRIMLPDDSVNEDLCICRTYKSYLEVHYGIRFAPVEVAERFCYESGPPVGQTYGFHGLSRLADLYVGETAPFLIENLQPYLFRRATILVLAMQYAIRDQHEDAAQLFRRIAQHQSYDDAREKLIAERAPAGHLEFLEQCWPRYLAS